MEYRSLGAGGVAGPDNPPTTVSVVGLGTWAFGGDAWGPADDRESEETIRAALDAGVTLIDTAPAYGDGRAEEVVGRAIAGRRHEVVIATKMGIQRRGPHHVVDLSPDAVRREIEDSLRRLNVDTIDLYQVHWPDKNTPIEETVEALARVHEAGRFRFLGVANFKPALMERVRAVFPLTCLQLHYSLLNRTPESHTLPYCAKHGLGALGYGSLAAGILTGKYRELPRFAPGDARDEFYRFFREPVWSAAGGLLETLRAIARERERPVSQVAINWSRRAPVAGGAVAALTRGGVTCALVGARTAAQARENAASGEWKLSSEELSRIERAWREQIAPRA